MLLAIACDQDPLGCAVGKLPGGYGLEQWEGAQHHYLRGPGETPSGGVLEGTVTEIGWTDEFIVARRHANFRGDPDGWMVINIRTRMIRGPVPEAQWRLEPGLRGIVITSSTEAWKKLPKCRSLNLT